MKVDRGIWGTLEQAPAQAGAVEAAGYDALIAAEVKNDPFLQLTLAAEHTRGLELMTSIAVAFSRSPMTLAQTAHDLNEYAKGRLILGVGSQIRAHITRRFSMPWSKPAARMREFVQAMRAIWACWNEGEALDFRGEFYQHTLMTPNFHPFTARYGAPRVFLAAVGPRMTEVAGEVADGMIAHGFTTERYLREVTLPALERGLARGGRARSDFQLCCPLFVVSGHDDEEFAARRQAVRAQVAFYASTPAYRPVLELHGWGEVQSELNRMSKAGQWDEMGERIDDEMLDAFAVVAPPERVADRILERYGDLLDRTAPSFEPRNAESRRALIERLHAG